MTNNTIVGEVEFFKIVNSFLELPAETRYPKNSTLDISNCYGVFCGTDFTYLYSEELRNLFEDNLLEQYQ